MTWLQETKLFVRNFTGAVFLLVGGILGILLGAIISPFYVMFNVAKDPRVQIGWLQRIGEELSDLVFWAVWLFYGLVPGLIGSLVRSFRDSLRRGGK